MTETVVTAERPDELNDQQLDMLARAERARGETPIAALASKDSDGRVTEVWWSCDLSCIGPNSVMVRAQLALESFYSDLSDPRTARGFRRVTDPGGQPAVERLSSLIESVMQHLLH